VIYQLFNKGNNAVFFQSYTAIHLQRVAYLKHHILISLMQLKKVKLTYKIQL